MIVGSDAEQRDPATDDGGPGSPLTTTARAVAVFLAYDCAETAHSALGFLDQISARLSGELGLDVRVWRMDLIEDAEGGWQARADAAAADLMMVALGPTGVLTSGFNDWLEEWAAHGELQEAALALWTTSAVAETLAPTAARLQHLAERHGLAFVCGTAVAGLSGRASLLTEPHHQSQFVPLPLSASFRDVPLGEWGINE